MGIASAFALRATADKSLHPSYGLLGGLAKNMATAKGHDIVDCAGTAFIRFNDDGCHPRTHLGCDRVYKVGIERRHHGITTKSSGGAESSPQCHTWCAGDQTDQRPGSGANPCSQQ